ncbi:MAG TPA: lytic transglycosylase, partial [Gemmobacter sp.]|nr:lytic transglycosylase [Gemmobacter sp.]
MIRALLAQGRGPEAEAEARRAWVDLSFSAEDERQLFQLYPGLTDLHADRLSRLLWQGRTREAERMLPRVSADWAALARARIALLDRAEGVTRLVDAVPAALAQHPLLAHARMDWRIWRDLWPGATELMLAHSETAALLGSPEAWAKRRAQLARQLLRDGDSRQAYRIAARHSLTTGGDYADLEFLAGFIALRRLNDAETAYRHFRHLEENVSTPISLSRAYYWQGRALEAMGDPGADATYRRAAEHQTAYYGQLAAERLGLPLQASLLAPLAAPDWRSRPFAQSSVLEAALLLLKAGDRVQGKRFILHLAESLSAADLASLAALTLQIREPHIAVLLGKQGAERGIILPDAYFPQTPLVPDQGLSVSRPLALAISRRESEFDVAARSPAGARGLMQLMPETARRMAADRGEAFDPARLTTDPAYNARLGTAYLAALVQE